MVLRFEEHRSEYVLSGWHGLYLKDEMNLKSRRPIPLYYESLYGI